MYRVAHAGTGLTGREALCAILDDPTLELVALWVSTPDKVGVDAGLLCGRPATGIVATDDVGSIIAMRPQCVSYCSSAVGREAEAVADIARFLAAGIDVVAISVIPMVYPPAAPAKWLTQITAATVTGQSTFYATGGEPGALSMNIPTGLLSCAGRIDSYRMDEYALGLDESYPIWEVLHESMGFGKPNGHVPARIASGKVNQDWEPVVRYLADILGVPLEQVELDWETVLAPCDLPSAVGVFTAGTICAHRWRLAGMVDGSPAVAVQYFATLSSTPWPDGWPKPTNTGTHAAIVYRVEGRPRMSMELGMLPHDPADGANPGVIASAMAAVNAIPAVIDAQPGVLTRPLSGPAIVTRLNAR